MLDLLQSSISGTKNLHNFKNDKIFVTFLEEGGQAGRIGCRFANFMPLSYSDYQIVQNYLLGSNLIIM